MDNNDSISRLQAQIQDVFERAFGVTSLRERLEDIDREHVELQRFTTVKNLKEEAGDLLASLMQLCNENGWDAQELLDGTIEKIERRMPQYKSQRRKKRVALFGGSFDPVTIGHVKAAEFVLKAGNVDEVWMTPCFKSMHGKELADASLRMEMLKAATKNNPYVQVFDYEIRHQFSGETIHLVRKLQADPVYDMIDFYFVIGMDNANGIKSWVDSEELIRSVKFIVLPRKGVDMEPGDSWFLEKPHLLLNDENAVPEVSSSEVRGLLNTDTQDGGLRLSSVLNHDVYEIIKQHNVY